MFLITVATFGVAMPAAAKLWPNDYFRFFSTDARLITVVLHYRFSKPGDPEVRLQLPRAWITLASGYDPTRIEDLPDEVVTDHIEVILVEPDGEAMTTAIVRLSSERGVSLTTARDALRSVETIVTLSQVDPSVSRSDYRQAREFDRRDAYMDNGLERSRLMGQYIGRPMQDLFVDADCQHQAKASFSCNHLVPVGPNVTSSMTFLDFRFNGGLDFANSRIRTGLAALCRQIASACDASHIQN